jgi:hypothetical protein
MESGFHGTLSLEIENVIQPLLGFLSRGVFRLEVGRVDAEGSVLLLISVVLQPNTPVRLELVFRSSQEL